MMLARLRIFDLDQNTARTVMVTDKHIEAPNWAPFPDSMIVNAEGLLYRVPLDDPKLQWIDTGILRRLNNDHGISPDGALLAISDKTETGRSCVSVLPASGGTPRRLTMHTPSWWHGWSPDGTNLVYTCVRNETFGIAAIPVTGGEETVLISGPGHYDGPDYTPDGAHIWFNSDRGGTMQLWRMGHDGANAEQMTDEATVNWFPHPSPDGRHVLYLGYAQGTEGHPADLPVTLRLMDLTNHTTRELIALRGGQGTINVPCWAPDSRRFAYVDYPHPEAQGD
jgi:Tol biopolymer transport system component